MKILEVTAFSAGICGVGTRALAEAKMLAKQGHEVHLFSSDIFRGTGENKTAVEEEEIENVKIKRFPTKFSFGNNTYFWNYEKQALKLKPDIIITHAYRQYYSTLALRISKKLKIPCFLVTHAPFLEKKLRSRRLNLAVYLYDKFIGSRILNKYNKILAITKWEIPYLLKLGAEKNKIEHIPNGIPEEFFKKPAKKNTNKILFFGRIAPIKNLECLIKAMKNTRLKLDIIGPSEEKYKKQLLEIIKNQNIKNIRFLPPIYDLDKKIDLIDKYETFVLPSKREAMPQALIEVMARGKIVISSKTQGGLEIIKNNENGFLFEINNSNQLTKILKKIQNLPEKQKQLITKNARKSVEKYAWKNLIKKINKILVNTKI